MCGSFRQWLWFPGQGTSFGVTCVIVANRTFCVVADRVPRCGNSRAPQLNFSAQTLRIGSMQTLKNNKNRLCKYVQVHRFFVFCCMCIQACICIFRSIFKYIYCTSFQGCLFMSSGNFVCHLVWSNTRFLCVQHFTLHNLGFLCCDDSCIFYDTCLSTLMGLASTHTIALHILQPCRLKWFVVLQSSYQWQPST